MTPCFTPADILLPHHGISLPHWSVIACDQYTQNSEYWQKLAALIGNDPSTLHLILPEIYLEQPDVATRIQTIHATMQRYEHDILTPLHNALIYVERTQPDGRIRCGLVGKLDLQAYDYTPGTKPRVRATEGTVLTRIPPRMQIRTHAELELPHIMLLCDDPEDRIFSICRQQVSTMQLLYDFSLCMGGGSLRGYLCTQAQKAKIAEILLQMEQAGPDPFVFAVGDGNHSLATAKACYEAYKKEFGPVAAAVHPTRYALCELVNLYSDALDFEPIYRVVFTSEPNVLLRAFRTACPVQNGGCRYTAFTAKGQQEFSAGDGTMLPVSVLQSFLDTYLANKPDIRVDYIHGASDAKALAQEKDCVAFLFDGIKKTDLFPAVRANGALPRKTFSMGCADDKRFYLECRKIL